jgi:hypothetical protein
MFSSTVATPGVSSAAALRGSTDQHQGPQTHQVAVTGPATMEPRVAAPLHQHEQKATGYSVGAPNTNVLPLDNLIRIVTVAQQSMT